MSGKHRNRSAEYYRKRYARRRADAHRTPRTSVAKRTPFIALDGEALDNRYVLLCASTGETLVNFSGITTLQVFEWLLALKEKYPDSILFGFSFNYDVNMFVRDLTPAKLETLWVTGECEWLSRLGTFYRLEWIPSKRFRVSTGTRYTDTLRSATISDVFGFFQMSFVSSLTDWNIPDEDGALRRIVSGKAERGTFHESEIRKVTKYCLAECRMAVKLMDTLRDVFYSAGIRPQSWNGAGSAAAAVLKKHRVRDYHRTDEELPQGLRNAVMRAYYGGRSEVFLQGFVGDCVGYDINSAYPAEAAKLPSLIGQWDYTRTYDPDAAVAVWRVVWERTDDIPVQPFPSRDKKAITYPLDGAGWYWQDEVRAAIALHGERIRITAGWVYTPEDDTLPFDFVHEYYRLKAEAKAAGRAEQKAYKLALNSLYGKLAQGTGYRNTVPWQRSYVWAGLITSGTRARLLEIATHKPEAVTFMATDGIVFREDPKLTPTDALGGLDKSRYPNLFVAQSGIYCASDNAGRDVFRSRGFFKREVSFDRLKERWRVHGPQAYDVTAGRRFVGLGTALGRTDPPRWSVWCEWQDTERRIELYPDRKYIDPLIADDLDTHTIPVPDYVRWVSPAGTTGHLSAPYKPKTTGTPADADPLYVQAMEQPYPDESE